MTVIHRILLKFQIFKYLNFITAKIRREIRKNIFWKFDTPINSKLIETCWKMFSNRYYVLSN